MGRAPSGNEYNTDSRENAGNKIMGEIQYGIQTMDFHNLNYLNSLGVLIGSIGRLVKYPRILKNNLSGIKENGLTKAFQLNSSKVDMSNTMPALISTMAFMAGMILFRIILKTLVLAVRAIGYNPIYVLSSVVASIVQIVIFIALSSLFIWLCSVFYDSWSAVALKIAAACFIIGIVFTVLSMLITGIPRLLALLFTGLYGVFVLILDTIVDIAIVISYISYLNALGRAVDIDVNVMQTAGGQWQSQNAEYEQGGMEPVQYQPVAPQYNDYEDSTNQSQESMNLDTLFDDEDLSR